MRRSLSVLILGLFLSTGSTAPQNQAGPEESATGPRYDEAIFLLDTWLQSIVDYDRLPGLSIAVVDDQSNVYSKGFGFSDRDRKSQASPSTVYSICSISKVFTAISIMQLRDAGKLGLDDPVTKFLPWFQPEGLDPGGRPPTLGELLQHSAGLPCAPDWTVWEHPADAYPSRDELVKRVSEMEMVYPPDTHFNYSNLGYSLLGQVVTEVSGMDYVDYVRKNILAPLGLDATTPYPPPPRPGLQVAKGYGCHQRTGRRPDIVTVDPRAVTPALGFYSSVEDLAKLAMWQFRALDGEDASVLRRETLEEMYSPHWPDPAWGLGFTIWNMGERVFIGHQGGCPGYKSQIIICPEERIAVVVMVNATDAPQFTLAFRTFEIMAPVLRSPSSDTVESKAWNDYVGFYTSANTWSDAEVLSWRGELALRWVPGGNPDPVGSLVALTRVEGEIFRQVNSDGKLGKHYIFRKDADGNVVSLKFNNNLLRKAAF